MIQLLYICYLMPPSNHRVWPTISSALLLNFANQWLKSGMPLSLMSSLNPKSSDISSSIDIAC